MRTSHLSRFVFTVAAVFTALFFVAPPQAFASSSWSTTTTLALSTSFVPQGTAVTLTASVVPIGFPGPVHPGTVNFYDTYGSQSNVLIGTAQAQISGRAVLVVRLGPGVHSIVAKFMGTISYLASSSDPGTLTVFAGNISDSSTTLSSSGTPGNYTLDATVIAPLGQGAGPSGTVSFTDETKSTTLGSAALGTPSIETSLGTPQLLPGIPVYAPLPGNGDVLVGDINNDGTPDVVFLTPGGNLFTYIGNGDGTFAPPTFINIPPFALKGVLADVNNDGYLDLAFVLNNGAVEVALNNHAGGFYPPNLLFNQPLSTTATHAGIAAGDFNHDGNLDLAVVWDTSNVGYILNGDGAGTSLWNLGASLTFLQQPTSLAVGDFNGDGLPDVAVGDAGAHSINVYVDYPSGVVSSLPITSDVGIAPNTIAAADFNHDNQLDLAVGDSALGQVQLLLNSGGNFFPYGVAQSVPSVQNLAVVDVNLDGIPDVVYTSGQGFVGALVVDPGGNALPIQNYVQPQLGAPPSALAVGDFNGDGLPDIAAVTDSSSLFPAGLTILNTTGWTASAQLSNVSVAGNSDSHSVDATFSGGGDSSYGDSTSNTVTLIGVLPASTTTLSVPSSANYQDTVTLSATVAPSTGSGTPTGTVTFYDGTTSIGTGTLDNSGMASITVNTLAVGPHSISASYGGDSTYATSSSSGSTLTINLDPTATVVTTSVSSSTFLQPLVYTATVTSSYPGTLTGSVSFYVGTRVLATGSVGAGGTVSVISLFTPVGTDDIKAVYEGDSTFATSESSPISIIVSKGITTTALTSSSSTPSQGQAITLTAAVTFPTLVSGTAPSGGGHALTATRMANPIAHSPALVRFTGTVNFYDTYGQDKNVLVGTAQVTGAKTAIIHLVPGPGAHSYVAVYVGDYQFVGSTAPAQAVTVTVPSPLGVTANLSSSGSAGNYTLTGTVSAPPYLTAGPTGKLTFTDESKSNTIGTANLGTATLATSWAAGTTENLGSSNAQVALGDVNGDGFVDVVSFDSTGMVYVTPGKGDGTFGTTVPLEVAPNPEAVALADLNNDGRLDIIVGHTNGTFGYLIQNSDGTFQTERTVTLPDATNCKEVAVGDFNDDGYLDVAIADAGSNQVYIALNNRNSTFQAPLITSVGNSPAYLAVGDLNGDGIPDLVVADSVGVGFNVLVGNGDGTFQAPQPHEVTNTPSSVTLADLDGDGKLDFIIPSAPGGYVFLLKGDGSGAYTIFSGASVNFNPTRVAVADMNGDGIPDLVVGGSSGTQVEVLPGGGKIPIALSEASNSPFVAVADFNGDGRPDIAAMASGTPSTLVPFLNTSGWSASAQLTGVKVFGNSDTHNVDFSYLGDTNYATATSNQVQLTGVLLGTTTTLSVPLSANLGDTVTISATVAPTSGSGTPTGNVDFYDGTTLITTAALDGSGKASMQTNTLTIGNHVLKAVYVGDNVTYATSTSDTSTLTINEDPTVTVVTTSVATSTYGSLVTLTATISSSYTLYGSPTGTVTFYVGKTALPGAFPVNSGVANSYTLFLPVGSDAITATYLGNANYAASTSDATTVTVSKAATNTALVASTNTPTANQAISLTATATAPSINDGGNAPAQSGNAMAGNPIAHISPGSLAVKGTVNFYDSYGPEQHMLVGTGQVTSSGTVVIHVVPGPGAHIYTAEYVGTNNFAGSASSAQAVNAPVPSPIPSTSTLAMSGTSGNYTLTGTVTASPYLASGPVGKLTFTDETKSVQVGTATLGTPMFSTSFALKQSFDGAVNEFGMVLADINGDGIPDTVYATSGPTPAVYVGIGNGDGTFQTPTMISVAAEAQYLVVADMNNDGIPDIVVSHSTGSFGVLLGNGHGGFGTEQTVTLPGAFHCGSVAVADLNGDGNLDVVETSGDTNQVFVALGNGNGTFQTPQPYTVGTYPQGVTIGDFNGDGIPDLAVADPNSSDVDILIGNGDGTFATPQTYPLGTKGFSITAADLNGDGHLDLAIGDTVNKNLVVLLNNGDGTFQKKASYSAPDGPFSVVAADVNRDGIPDLVTSTVNGGAPQLFLGKGDGTFWPPVSVTTEPTGTAVIAVGDMNGDGLPDIAATTITESPGVLSILNTSQWSAQAQLTSVAVPGAGDTHNVNFNYPGDENYTTSTSNQVELIGSQVTTTTTLSAPSSEAYGQAVTLTATLSPATYNGHDATGNVNFYDGETLIATGTVSSGTVTGIVTGLSVGPHSITASYAGDDNFLPSTSGLSSVTITQAATSTALSVSAPTVLVDQPVTLTATVTASVGGPEGTQASGVHAHNEGLHVLGVTGTVAFKEGDTTFATGTVNSSGVATVQVYTLPAGAHNITAVYSGDTNYLTSNSTASTVTVQKIASATALSVSLSNLYPGENVTLTATVTGGSETSTHPSGGTLSGTHPADSIPTPGTPTGTVTFMDGDTTLGTGTVNSSGVATMNTTSLAVGAHNITAVYSGDATYDTSTSTSSTVTVTKLNTTTAVTTSNSNSNLNSSVTFTATVTNATLSGTAPAAHIAHRPEGPGTPTGTVNFMDGTTTLGSGTLDESGVATFSTSKLAAGSHDITAVYVGDMVYSGSTSSVVKQQVTAPDYTIVANPDVINIKLGQTGGSTLIITPIGGYAGDVTLGCSNLPAYTTCVFTPTTLHLPGDNKVQTVQLEVITAGASASLGNPPAPFGGSVRYLGFSLGVPGLMGILLLPKRKTLGKKSRWLVVISLVILFAIMLGMTGCGAGDCCKLPTPPPGTYTATATASGTATGGGTGLNHSVNITINITQ